VRRRDRGGASGGLAVPGFGRQFRVQACASARKGDRQNRPPDVIK
jgi:hypothetical protein